MALLAPREGGQGELQLNFVRGIVIYCLKNLIIACFIMHGIKVLCSGYSLSPYVKINL